MEERDDALDFIYKGWREGRQQRRDFANQRGADRIAARRERMSRIGSPSMPIPRKPSTGRRGPPSRTNVASSPPSSSSSWVNPVEQVIARNNAARSFSDDISTPDDESTPQNEAAPVQETVSSPPSSDEPMNRERAMATLDMSVGGSGATESRYDPSSPKPSQAMVSPEPDARRAGFYEAPEYPYGPEKDPQKPSLDESFDVLDRKVPYNQDGERIPKSPKPRGMGEGEYERTTPSVQPAKPDPPERYQAPEMPFMKPSVEGYKKTPITRLKPDGGSGEAVPEKTATLKPVKQLKPVEQQHKESFETAYEEMKDEATQPEIPDEIDFSRPPEAVQDEEPVQPIEREPSVDSVVEQTKNTPKPKPAKAVVEATKKPKKAAPKKAKAETKKPSTGGAKATKTGAERLRAASDKLAEAGMGGKAPKSEEADDKKKVQGESTAQSLKNIEKPKDDELRRSADQQMLADVLLKKLPVADLRMFGRATGIEDIAPLLDDKGFMTQVVGVDPSHSMMMGISDKPDFEQSIQPAIGFDLGKLKFNNSYPGFPQNRKPTIDDLITPPMKTVNALDDEGHTIVADTVKRQEWDDFQQKHVWRDVPIYETKQVEDEGIGWFIRDGNSHRRMTRAEAKEILSQRAAGSPFKGAGKLDFATPYFDTEKRVWRLPIIEGKGSPRELPKSPWRNFSFAETKPIDASVVPVPKFPKLDLKEIAAFSPKELKERFKGLKPKENPLTRIGNSTYQTQYLKDLVSGMTPSNMTDEDIRFSNKTNHPLLSEGRGVVRYDENPSYWKHFLAPRIEGDENAWESMNDLFE